MPIWIEAMDNAERVYNLTISLPRSEDYGLTSQIRRSANSIAANIAEAFGRFHTKDKINFYYFACGSIAETQSHLVYGDRVNYFPEGEAKMLIEGYDELKYKIHKVIKTLKTNE